VVCFYRFAFDEKHLFFIGFGHSDTRVSLTAREGERYIFKAHVLEKYGLYCIKETPRSVKIERGVFLSLRSLWKTGDS